MALQPDLDLWDWGSLGPSPAQSWTDRGTDPSKEIPSLDFIHVTHILMQKENDPMQTDRHCVHDMHVILPVAAYPYRIERQSLGGV